MNKDIPEQLRECKELAAVLEGCPIYHYGPTLLSDGLQHEMIQANFKGELSRETLQAIRDWFKSHKCKERNHRIGIFEYGLEFPGGLHVTFQEGDGANWFYADIGFVVIKKTPVEVGKAAKLNTGIKRNPVIDRLMKHSEIKTHPPKLRGENFVFVQEGALLTRLNDSELESLIGWVSEYAIIGPEVGTNGQVYYVAVVYLDDPRLQFTFGFSITDPDENELKLYWGMVRFSPIRNFRNARGKLEYHAENNTAIEASFEWHLGGTYER